MHAVFNVRQARAPTTNSLYTEATTAVLPAGRKAAARGLGNPAGVRLWRLLLSALVKCEVGSLVAFGSAGAATQGGVVCLSFVHCALSGGIVDVCTGSPMRLVWMLRSVQSSAGDMTF
jgi:hypothetical protein